VRSLHNAHPTASVLVTGHSLGGALATFAGVDIKEELNLSATIYSFGSPRTGNQAFANHVFSLFGTEGYQRVTHYNDVVPHVPIEPMGFQHTGNEVWYKNPGTDLTYVQCANKSGVDENQSCSDSIVATGIDAHLTYLGIKIGDLCNQPQLFPDLDSDQTAFLQ
jgi:hypothetical protein